MRAFWRHHTLPKKSTYPLLLFIGLGCYFQTIEVSVLSHFLQYYTFINFFSNFEWFWCPINMFLSQTTYHRLRRVSERINREQSQSAIVFLGFFSNLEWFGCPIMILTDYLKRTAALGNFTIL